MSTRVIRLSSQVGRAIVDALKREGKLTCYFCSSILNQLLAAASTYEIINEQLNSRYSCFFCLNCGFLYTNYFLYCIFCLKARLRRNNPIKCLFVVIRFVSDIYNQITYHYFVAFSIYQNKECLVCLRIY
jgi:hypothetical protein